jgi:hypothetical protein
MCPIRSPAVCDAKARTIELQESLRPRGGVRRCYGGVDGSSPPSGGFSFSAAQTVVMFSEWATNRCCNVHATSMRRPPRGRRRRCSLRSSDTSAGRSSTRAGYRASATEPARALPALADCVANSLGTRVARFDRDLIRRSRLSHIRRACRHVQPNDRDIRRMTSIMRAQDVAFSWKSDSLCQLPATPLTGLWVSDLGRFTRSARPAACEGGRLQLYAAPR